MVVPDIEKYAHGLWGLRDLTTYTSSVWNAGALTLINENREFNFVHDKYGFRKDNDEFGKRVAFGCSHTYGFEIPKENTWAFLLNATNFGVTGGSPQTVARLVKAWIPNSHVEEILILMPEKSRREIYNPHTHTYTALLPWMLDQFSRTVYNEPFPEPEGKRIMRFCEEFPHLNVMDEEQNERIFEESVDVIKRHVGDRKLVLKTMDDVPDHDWKSRDRTHNGENWHRKVAQIFQRDL